jgi:hypothetical protein
MISCCAQDCAVLMAPYPDPNPVETFNLKTDFDLQGDGLVWYARLQLVFNSTLCPTGAKAQGDIVQCYPQGGVPSILQHV